mgnify:CR=1 FL=1
MSANGNTGLACFAYERPRDLAASGAIKFGGGFGRHSADLLERGQGFLGCVWDVNRAVALETDDLVGLWIKQVFVVVETPFRCAGK